jgi:hypothetical protein
MLKIFIAIWILCAWLNLRFCLKEMTKEHFRDKFEIAGDDLLMLVLSVLVAPLMSVAIIVMIFQSNETIIKIDQEKVEKIKKWFFFS